MIPFRLVIFNWKDLSHPAAGGAERWIEEVARSLVERGHQVTLFASAVKGRPEREFVCGVEIVRRGSRLSVYREARRFWKAEGRRFDVVLDEVNTRPFMTPRFVKGVPILALIHQIAREVWFYEMPWPIAAAGRYILEPWWLRSYRRIPTITDSPSSAASLRGYGLCDVEPVPMGGVVVPRPDVSRESRPTVVFLGRLVKSKRPDHALEAFRSFRESHPDAQMWLIGDGPMASELRDRGLPAGAELLGYLPEADRIERLARAHVLIATSVREGWGLNVSEASALGTPTIGYRVAGLEDSVPASGGMLVEPTPVALAAGLAEFFTDLKSLTPRVSTVPWSEVADAVEGRLVVLLGRL
jgi:glycosyltransferase involved in cell wall biosynthesis